jgi:two-component system chemotaxis sensor kinase CheA
MSLDADEDILQDFLVEAGEILESLSEELVDLEKSPEDSGLLNAIFRGFHTVKGGAGFLNLNNLVKVCHGAENVFDELRNGKISVSSELMDVVLHALDTINAMFAQVQARDEPEEPDPQLLSDLEALAKGEAIGSQAEESSVEAASDITDDLDDVFFDDPETDSESSVEHSGESSGDDEITDDEFEALLDELAGVDGGASKSAPASPQSSQASAPEAGASDEAYISDDEFESLLDEIHGKGKGPAPAASAPSGQPSSSGGSNDDLITDDEFERLLDELHGKGAAPSANTEKPPAKPASKPAPKPTPPPQKKPAVTPKPEPKKAPSAKKAPEPPAKKSVAPAKVESKPAATPSAETTVRVDTKRLDDIMNMVGELVLVRNRLVLLGEKTPDEDLSKTIANLDVVTSDLQGAVMKTRMQPIKKVFGRFPRVVRDLSRSLKKDIALELHGEETDLDKNLVEALADPLVHLVRNAVDHGIEKPEDRENAGKPRSGTVVLAADQEGDHILLTIRDDGKGMDPEMLRYKAVEKGLMDQDAAARLTDTECFNLIFAPGFSTAQEISDISGRGVGMDVVKTKISQLNGSIQVDSELGKGTTLSIKVPLTLAILPTLMVVVGKQTFALPLANVNEIFHLDLTKTNIVDGQLTVVIRKKAVPLFYLEDWLVKHHQRSGSKNTGHVVIVQVGTKQIGFVVDSLLGQEEVVIKPLGPPLHGTPGMAGATITSDGGIALILDVPGLLKNYA